MRGESTLEDIAAGSFLEVDLGRILALPGDVGVVVDSVDIFEKPDKTIDGEGLAEIVAGVALLYLIEIDEGLHVVVGYFLVGGSGKGLEKDDDESATVLAFVAVYEVWWLVVDHETESFAEFLHEGSGIGVGCESEGDDLVCVVEGWAVGGFESCHGTVVLYLLWCVGEVDFGIDACCFGKAVDIGIANGIVLWVERVAGTVEDAFAHSGGVNFAEIGEDLVGIVEVTVWVIDGLHDFPCVFVALTLGKGDFDAVAYLASDTFGEIAVQESEAVHGALCVVVAEACLEYAYFVESCDEWYVMEFDIVAYLDVEEVGILESGFHEVGWCEGWDEHAVAVDVVYLVVGHEEVAFDLSYECWCCGQGLYFVYFVIDVVFFT